MNRHTLDKAIDFPITPFNQGETYRTRRELAMGHLAGVEFKGLQLDALLGETVSAIISRDVGRNPNWLLRNFRLIRGFLNYIHRNQFLRDLSTKPTLTIGLHSCSNADNQVSILMDPSRATVESQLLNIIGESPYVSLEIEPARKFTKFPPISRMLQYLWLYRKCFLRFNSSPFSLNHQLVMQTVWAADIVEQAQDLFENRRPKALFIYRDFQAIPNALVQAAQAYAIPTYSTQHAVHPQFTGKNERVGNSVFESSSSDVYVCWGSFSEIQMAQFLEKTQVQRRVVVHCRPTAANEQQLNLDKSSHDLIRIEELIVSLMGPRHEEDNAALLRLVFGFANGRPYRVTIRPHPSLVREKYVAYVNHLKAGTGVEVEITDAKATIQSSYTDRSLGITGLTSTYYENMFFGIPVVFFDFGIELVEPLPRVLPGVTSPEELAEQVNLIESTTWLEWYKKADRVCESVYNRKCLDFQPRESMIEFIRADVSQSHLLAHSNLGREQGV